MMRRAAAMGARDRRPGPVPCTILALHWHCQALNATLCPSAVFLWSLLMLESVDAAHRYSVFHLRHCTRGRVSNHSVTHIFGGLPALPRRLSTIEELRQSCSVEPSGAEAQSRPDGSTQIRPLPERAAWPSGPFHVGIHPAPAAPVRRCPGPRSRRGCHLQYLVWTGRLACRYGCLLKVPRDNSDMADRNTTCRAGTQVGHDQWHRRADGDDATFARDPRWCRRAHCRMHRHLLRARLTVPGGVN